jgi:hypothetical protein
LYKLGENNKKLMDWMIPPLACSRVRKRAYLDWAFASAHVDRKQDIVTGAEQGRLLVSGDDHFPEAGSHIIEDHPLLDFAVLCVRQ